MINIFLESVLSHQRKHIQFVHVGAQTLFLRTVGRQLFWAFGLQWTGRSGPVNYLARSNDFNPLDF